MATSEVWKPVPGYTDYYEVSTLGRVRSVDREVIQISPWDAPMRRRLRGKVLAAGLDSEGYLLVNLSFQNRAITRKVAHLVLEAFIGECPTGLQGCHYDGNPANNQLSNLRWDTPLGNEADKLRHGNRVQGERQGGSKLTRKDVLEIRASSLSGKKLAKLYGVSTSTISFIIKRKSWRWL